MLLVTTETITGKTLEMLGFTVQTEYNPNSTYEKGIVESVDGTWLHFDYVPGEVNVRAGSADIIGRICVIGSALNVEKISEGFGV